MSDYIARLMEQDFEESVTSAVDKVDTEGLRTVAGLARQIQQKEEDISVLEETLKKEKKNLLRLTDEELPSVLTELGLTEFKLDDGSSVTVKPTYGASIRVADRPQAYQWLRDHGYDDIIKNTVSVVFGRGEDDEASSFQHFARQNGYAPEQKEDVHPSTLRAFVKERVENGDVFPMELFGAFIGQRAVIKKGKS